MEEQEDARKRILSRIWDSIVDFWLARRILICTLRLENRA